MVFQNIIKDKATLSTDFDFFEVTIRELETNIQENDIGIKKLTYTTPQNSLSATISANDEDNETLIELMKVLYEPMCYPKYFFTLETDDHVFMNGIIMTYDYTLTNGYIFELKFDAFVNKQ